MQLRPKKRAQEAYPRHDSNSINCRDAYVTGYTQAIIDAVDELVSLKKMVMTLPIIKDNKEYVDGIQSSIERLQSATRQEVEIAV